MYFERDHSSIIFNGFTSNKNNPFECLKIIYNSIVTAENSNNCFTMGRKTIPDRYVDKLELKNSCMIRGTLVLGKYAADKL